MICEDSGGSGICIIRYRYTIINEMNHFSIKIKRIFQKISPEKVYII